MLCLQLIYSMIDEDSILPTKTYSFSGALASKLAKSLVASVWRISLVDNLNTLSSSCSLLNAVMNFDKH